MGHYRFPEQDRIFLYIDQLKFPQQAMRRNIQVDLRKDPPLRPIPMIDEHFVCYGEWSIWRFTWSKQLIGAKKMMASKSSVQGSSFRFLPKSTCVAETNRKKGPMQLANVNVSFIKWRWCATTHLASYRLRISLSGPYSRWLKRLGDSPLNELHPHQIPEEKEPVS